MSKKKTKNPNLNKKFKIFVKVLNDEGYFDESKFGWLKLDPKTEILPVQMNEAHTFIEKEDGHGSFDDWKRYFEYEHEDWVVCVKYI